jgi:S1-C subfamily serine protease
VLAIGNPFGVGQTVTQGIVSAVARTQVGISDYQFFIQTDAAINPGNSGGPLLDRSGRLIGVNTAITSPTGASVGIGYAIPVDTVNPVVTQLIRTGRAARPSLGVVLLRERDTRAIGYDQGVMIAEVRPGSAAAKAGLVGFRTDPDTGRQLPGDVILAVDGEPVDGIADFERAMSKWRVGQTVRLTVRRGQQTREVNVTLEGI